MADDVLMFDVKPKNENELYVVFDKVTKMFEKLLVVGKSANDLMDKVTKTVGNYASGKWAQAKQYIGEKLSNVVPAAKQFVAGKMEAVAGPTPVGVVTSVIGAVIEGAKKLANVLLGLPALVRRFTDTLSEYVQYSNPAIVQRVDWAWQDLWATIGQKVAPILEAFAEAIEHVADVIAAADFRSFVNSIAEFVRKLGGLVGQLIKMIIPIVEGMARVLVPAIEALAWFTDKLTNAFSSLTRIVNGLVSLFTGNLRGFIQNILPNHDARFQPGARTPGAGSISVLGLEQVSNRALEAAGRIGGRDHLQNIDNNVANIAGAVNAAGQVAAAAQQAQQLAAAAGVLR